MYSFQVHDVNEALAHGIRYLLQEGIEEKSRNGSVIVAPGPVCTEYVNPRRRVLYSPTRNANPFFHLMEAIWFLSGEYSVEFPCYFNKSYSQFSDDGVGMWDGYGWRWRQFFGWDQLPPIIEELKANPGSRRCVLSMWNSYANCDHHHPIVDVDGGYPFEFKEDFHVATHGGKAVPCNTHAYLDCRGGVLNMTICNRSNDIIFGCYGANVVHMSILQEYIATHVGVPVGVYRQFSNNFHAYTDVFSREKMKQIADESEFDGGPFPGPTIEPGFDEDLKLFMSWAKEVIHSSTNQDEVPALKTAFMSSVVVPMFLAWTYRKRKDEYSMNICLDGIEAPDWRLACGAWVDRRHINKETRPL